MNMPGRTYASGGTKYRYAFNGKETEDEIAEGDYDFGARIYDSRLGRWMGTDPSEAKYPGLSTYAFCYNSPLLFKDPDGRDGRISIDYKEKKVTIETVVHIYGPNAKKGMADIYNGQSDNILGTIGEFIDISGEKWTVEIKVKYCDDNIEELNRQTKEMLTFIPSVEDMDVSRLSNFQEGDNLMMLSGKWNSGADGGTGVGANGGIVYQNAFYYKNERTIFHETLHELGFDHWFEDGVEWINAGSDLYKKYTDVMESGPAKVENLMFHPIHYESILKFAKGLLSQSGKIAYKNKKVNNKVPKKGDLKKSEKGTTTRKRTSVKNKTSKKYTNQKHYKRKTTNNKKKAPPKK